VFYNLFDRVGSEDQLALNVPGLVNNSVTQTSVAPVFVLQQGIPATFLATPNLDPAAGQLSRLRIRAVSEDAPKTTTQQTSVGLQRELAGAIIATADFVYTRGSNLASLINLNQPLPGSPGANNAIGPLPYPNFGFIEWRAQNGKSEYKGVDLGVEKRFARGHAFGVAYTIGDSTDNTSEQLTTQGSSAFPQDSRNVSNWFGPSDYDVRHRLSLNFVVSPRFGDNLVGRDWTISGVYAARSGRPFTVNQSNNNVGQSMTGLPDVVGDVDGPQTVDRWFNTAAFQAVTSGTFGNERRNRLRGPGFQSVDLSLQRAFRCGSACAASIRWDVFNVFNTTNFGLPNRNLSDAATFGTISSLAGDPRTMQIAVRFTF
jgi:hypothetical protein